MEVKIKYKPRLDFVEVDITTKCNLNCYACNRYISAAPENDEMSIEQIEKFLKESEDYNWKSIAIMGGEPLLHSRIDDVIDLFRTYARSHRKTNVKLITNGTIKKKVPKILHPYSSGHIKSLMRKGKVINKFGNVLLAPVDRIKGDINDCKITATCGLGLNRYGYYPCGCGGAVCRVVGISGIRNLKQVTQKSMIDILKQVCQYCGRNLEYQILCKKNRSISPFWKDALQKYKERKPELELY